MNASFHPFLRFVLIFLSLHSIHYITVYMYSLWCLDTTMWGYFTSMISGHNPVCHLLFTISYHAEYEIFTHLRAAGVVAGVTWITDQVLRSTNTQAPSSPISRTTTAVLSPRYEVRNTH